MFGLLDFALTLMFVSLILFSSHALLLMLCVLFLRERERDKSELCLAFWILLEH